MKFKSLALYGAILSGLAVSLPASAQTTAGSMDVQIVITANCTVSSTTSTLDFGSNPSTAADASASNGGFSVTCSNQTPYKIGLKSNSTGAVDDGVGVMASTAPGVTQTIGYQLYQNPGFTTVWGNATTGTANIKTATGTGTAQTYTVYGKTTTTLNVPAATYTDTVAINVYY
ncbi:spore coat U domain-containing protein [Castellaniella sp. GW247-6E4]|uniref:Csu type fimbrial protein n=1 Tax=Castellaniella sp. GW247-6E4 TaxID=3140380 RepID=UPI0033154950